MRKGNTMKTAGSRGAWGWVMVAWAATWLWAGTFPAQALVITSIRRINPPSTGLDQIRGKPGDQVEIRGTGLASVTSIRFGLGTATFSGSDQRLVAIIPPTATIGSLSLYDSWGLAWASDFNFQVAPRITKYGRSLPQPQGPGDALRGVPGNSVRFEGDNFADPGDPNFTTRAWFPAAAGGYVPAVTEFASGTSMQVTIPQGAASGAPVLVNPAGSVELWGNFYLQPVVTSFEPSSARVGDTVTIKGVSLVDAFAALVGNASATIVSATATNVVIVVPPMPASGRVSITTPGGTFLATSNLVLLPRVRSFSPAGGKAGDVVTLVGDGLGGASGVAFGGVSATVWTNVSSVQVNVVVPQGALAGAIRLTTPNGSDSTTTPFYVAPVVADVQPSTAKPGAVVAVTGSNFIDVSRVEFGGGVSAVFTVVTTNRIDAVVPAGAQAGPVAVTNPGGKGVSARSFVPASTQPQVTGFVPAFGPPGTTVTITGDNLSGTTVVRFNGLNASGFTVQGDTRVLAVVPPGATTGRITVVTDAGSAQSATSFLVGSTANLSVVGQAMPADPWVTQEVSFTFQLSNAGPIPSSGTALTVGVPASATYVGSSITAGTFDLFDGAVVFSPGQVQPGASILATVRMRFAGTTSVAVTANASANTADPDPASNTATVTVRPARPDIGMELLPDGRVSLVWPSGLVGVTLQQGGSLAGPWAVVPGTVEETPVGRRMVLDAGSAMRLYRLAP